MPRNELPNAITSVLQKSPSEASILTNNDREHHITSGYFRLQSAWEFANKAREQGTHADILKRRFLYLYVHAAQTQKSEKFNQFAYERTATTVPEGYTMVDIFAERMIQQWEEKIKEFPPTANEITGYRVMQKLSEKIGQNLPFEQAILQSATENGSGILALLGALSTYTTSSRAIEIDPPQRADKNTIDFQVHIQRISDNPVEQTVKTIRALREKIADMKQHIPPGDQKKVRLVGVSHLVNPEWGRVITGFSINDGAQYQTFDVNTILTQLFEQKKQNPDSFYPVLWFKKQYPDAPVPFKDILRTAVENFMLSNASTKDFLSQGRFPAIGTVVTAPGTVLQ